MSKHSSTDTEEAVKPTCKILLQYTALEKVAIDGF
jgi:hypothetical protein